ncbi:unnamed protein product, partial [marine sediment metagenome]
LLGNRHGKATGRAEMEAALHKEISRLLQETEAKIVGKSEKE